MSSLAFAAYSTGLGTSVSVVLRVVSVGSSNTHLFILLRALRLLVTRCFWLLRDNYGAWSTLLSAVVDALAIDSFRGLISLKSKWMGVSTSLQSLPIWKSLFIFLTILLTRWFYSYWGHLHLVHRIRAGFNHGLVGLKHALSIDIGLRGIHGVLGSVSSNISRGLVARTIPLGLGTSTFFHNSGEASCNILSTLVYVCINNFVWVISVVVCILVHYHWRLVLILSLFKLVKPFVKLNISELLLNAAMGILSDVSVRISRGSSSWVAILHSSTSSWPESCENIARWNWRIVIVGWLPSKLAV